MLKIGICDDIEDEIRKQHAMVQRITGRMGMNVEIHGFRSGEELLQELQLYGHMDILLLDIEMEGKNGIETAKIIRETDFHTTLIFISAYDQYCKEMIEVQPFAFVDKPVTESALEDVIKKALLIKASESERFLFSNQKHRYSISMYQIMYFESMKRQIGIHCTDGQYEFYGKLNDVEKDVSNSKIKFARVQISYLVNLNYVKEWDYDRIIMDDNVEISISKKYRKAMKQYYIEILEGR